MDWDPDFVDRSPMLEPLREHAHSLRACATWPDRDALQAVLSDRAVVNADGAQLRLCAPGGESEPYEEAIRLRGDMLFREGEWHDLFNALAWAAYPATKAALNDAHYRALLEARARGEKRERGGSYERGQNYERGRRRDALTVFDENGAIVLSSSPSLLDDLRAFQWNRVFVERRDEVLAAMRFHLFGHALFEKALQPYVGMTAHALLLPVSESVVMRSSPGIGEVDALAAEAVHALATPRDLSPLPLLGVPGWWAHNERAAFYDNAEYFRTSRKRN